MRKKIYRGKRILPCITALMLAGAFFGGSVTGEAAYYIGYDNINIRDDAYGTVLGNIPKDTVVEITETKTGSDGNTWSHVTYTASDGTEKEGWVRSDLILGEADEETQETASEEESAGEEQEETEETESEAESAEEEETAESSEDTDTSEISGDGYASNGDTSFEVRGVTMTISDSYDEDDIPENFTAVSITYNGTEVTAFEFDSGEVYLVYLEAEDGSGDFYVLDTERDCVVSYIRLTAGSSFLILLLAPESEVISESYEKTLVATNDTDGITAYKYAQDAETLSADIETEDYCYIYGISQNGVAGWYLFDSENQTYIRATTDLSVDPAGEGDSEAASETDSLEKMLIVTLAALVLLFLVLTILFAVRSRRARRYLPEESYDDEEPEEQEIKFHMQRRREEREQRRETEDDFFAEPEEPAAENASGELPGNGGGDIDEMEQLLMNTLYGTDEPEDTEPETGEKSPEDNWDDDLEFLDL